MQALYIAGCAFTVNQVFSSSTMKYSSQNVFVFLLEMKIFLFVINLQTYIVEYGNYTEFVDFVAVKDYGIRRYCATMNIELRCSSMRLLSN